MLNKIIQLIFVTIVATGYAYADDDDKRCYLDKKIAIYDTVAVSNSYESFMINVIAKMTEGWQPLGGLSHTYGPSTFIQPIVKYEYKEVCFDKNGTLITDK